MFEGFFREELLPVCNPYPGPRSVIIIDNASWHIESNLQDLYDDARVLLRFLPPYSPDFNPIESSFGDIKAFIRRWYTRKRGEFRDYQAFVKWVIQMCCTGQEGA